MNLEHIKLSEDCLSKKIWVFNFIADGKIVFDSYSEMSRLTKRQKFKFDKRYNRLNFGNHQGNTLELIDIDIPYDVIKDILNQAIEKLQIVSDYQGTPINKRDV